ncbi:hypothetical protein FBULB1_4893 [Fusarium bulbicola]|nr:hypothetical protein FBULB1_4893 [Fusarium bulbicola]
MGDLFKILALIHRIISSKPGKNKMVCVALMVFTGLWGLGSSLAWLVNCHAGTLLTVNNVKQCPDQSARWGVITAIDILTENPHLAPRSSPLVVRQYLLRPKMPSRHSILIPNPTHRHILRPSRLLPNIPIISRTSIRRYKHPHLPTSHDRIVSHLRDNAQPEELPQVLLHRHGLSGGIRLYNVGFKQGLCTAISTEQSLYECSFGDGYSP